LKRFAVKIPYHSVSTIVKTDTRSEHTHTHTHTISLVAGRLQVLFLFGWFFLWWHIYLLCRCSQYFVQ